MSDYIHKLAKNKAEPDSVLCEPRVYYAPFVFDGSTQIVYADPDVFRNGERFPLRLTKLVMAMQGEAADAQSPVGGDERMVQRYGLRIRAHGTYYQNSLHTPLPLYANKVVATSPVTSSSLGTWKLDKPFIMGNRDAMDVRVQVLVVDQGVTEQITVSLSGVGLYSRQPKVFRGIVTVADLLEHAIDIDQFRNDGTEPFELHEVVVHEVPDAARANPIGLVRNVTVRMRNNGNGTNQWWVVGPPTAAQLVPAPLIGTGTGRAVVHELPGDGWLWYPGEGVLPEMRSFLTTREETVMLAMVGYIMVL